MECLPILTLENVISTANISVTTTRNNDIIMVNHMREMKNNLIVCNIGHFDNKIDISRQENDVTTKTLPMR